MTASIVGWAHTPFGKFDTETVESLIVRVTIDALADGIARQKLTDPDAVPDDLMGRVLSLLFAAVTRPAARS